MPVLAAENLLFPVFRSGKPVLDAFKREFHKELIGNRHAGIVP